MRVLSLILILILILIFETGAHAQAQRQQGPAVLPYHRNYTQFSPFLGNRSLPGVQSGNSLRFGQGQYQSYAPRRQAYQSPFTNSYGNQNRNSGFGSLISALGSMFGGNGGYNNGGMFGNSYGSNNGGGLFSGLGNIFARLFGGGSNSRPASSQYDFPSGNPPGEDFQSGTPPRAERAQPLDNEFPAGRPPGDEIETSLTDAPEVVQPPQPTRQEPPPAVVEPEFPVGRPPGQEAPPALVPPAVLPPDVGGTDSGPRPQTVAPRNPREGAIVTVPDSLTPDETQRIRQQHRANRASQNTPIWAPFYRRFKQCRPDCEPIGYSVSRAGSGASCHHSDRAIDMFGMACRDGVHMAINSTKTTGPIALLTNCMTGTRPVRPGANLRVKDGLGCLWHNGQDVRLGHKNHVHFSIGCGGGQW